MSVSIVLVHDAISLMGLDQRTLIAEVTRQHEEQVKAALHETTAQLSAVVLERDSLSARVRSMGDEITSHEAKYHTSENMLVDLMVELLPCIDVDIYQAS